MVIKFFKNLTKQNQVEELSDPIPVRLPQNLLAEVTSQAEEIGGSRYRSKHIVSLISIGANYYRASSDFVKGLSADHLAFLTRLHFVFDKLGLQSTKVAESLGHKDPVQVSAWMDGKVHPSFEEIESFCKYYFINENWLKHGNNSNNLSFTPHIVYRKSFNRNIESQLKFIAEYSDIKIETIRLIRDNTGRVVASVDYGNKRYVTHYFHNLKLKDEDSVGSGGFGDLTHLAAFCKLLDEYFNAVLTISYNVHEEDLEKIVTGECIPDDLGIWGQQHASHWYETIHSSIATKEDKDSSYWKGSISLFTSLQKSDTYERLINNIEKNSEDYKAFNYSYKQKFQSFEYFKS